MNTDKFTDRCALEKGLAVAEQKSPLLSEHIQSIRQQLELAAEKLDKSGFPYSAEGFRRFARDL